MTLYRFERRQLAPLAPEPSLRIRYHLGMDYHFPLLFLAPQFDGDAIEAPPFRIAKRKWETSIFDLYTLQAHHNTHLPAPLMDNFLNRCNSELCVVNQPSLEVATAAFESFRLALYSLGISPFLVPFITSHSINDYSGINSRDSVHGRERLPEGMRNGLTTVAGKVEAWPHELSFQCIVSGSLNLTVEVVREAATKCVEWDKLANNSLRVVADTAKAAPQLLSLDQSQLHIWSALEALFPEVSAELSFKVAVYLAQLVATDRFAYFERVRKSYKLRCGITHGSKRGINADQWLDTWGILMDSYNAILRRGKMPSEADLLAELLH